MWRFEIYIDRGGEHRWRLWSSNNRIVADSAEGYSSLSACEHGVELVKKNAPTAQVQVNTPR